MSYCIIAILFLRIFLIHFASYQGKKNIYWEINKASAGSYCNYEIAHK